MLGPTVPKDCSSSPTAHGKWAWNLGLDYDILIHFHVTKLITWIFYIKQIRPVARTSRLSFNAGVCLCMCACYMVLVHWMAIAVFCTAAVGFALLYGVTCNNCVTITIF